MDQRLMDLRKEKMTFLRSDSSPHGIVYADYMGSGLPHPLLCGGSSMSPLPLGNPHSAHPMGAASRDAMETARQRLLH